MNSAKTLLAGVAIMALLAGCANSRSRPASAEVDRSAATRSAAQRGPRGTAAQPRNAGLQTRYAQALEQMKTGQWTEAEAVLRSLTQSHPQYAGPWINLGILYAKTNRNNEARQSLARALSLQPDNAVALTWRGILERQAGQLGEAEDAYRRALAAHPAYALAHLNLGILYDRYLQRPALALQHYQRYRELAGNDDLRVAAWIAALEARPQITATTAAPGAVTP